jgi:putative phage-type endonuclease
MTPSTETIDPALLIQGSPEWHAARMGRITASRFADVLTQPRSEANREAGNLSATAESYMLDLVAEALTGEPQGPRENEAMRWGHLYEPEARAVYSELTGWDVTEVGFIVHPDLPEVGGSPDGLVDDGDGSGGIEIKCPFNTRIHLGYMLAGELPKQHIAQVQGLLWITDSDWWDFVSYDPRCDWPTSMFRVRAYRDGAYIEKLAKSVVNFRDRLLEALCTIKERTAV